MTEKITGAIQQKPITYHIIIEQGMFKSDAFVSYLSPLGQRFAIVTSDNLKSHFGEPLQKALKEKGWQAHLFTFPSGEHYKSRETKQLIEDQMLAAGLGRDTCLIAVGGGVTTDLGGFVAATYCRGIPSVTIPTSLMGMVDASLGGKTGVNVPQGKNMVGAIHQPKYVLIDPEVLSSLPASELKNGIVEMIKHGLIADADYYAFIEKNIEALMALDKDILEKAIAGSCRIKMAIVEHDEKEGAKRRLLNFGHTVAHALENLSHYTMSHGEAVAVGLIAECHLCMQAGYLDKSTFERIKKLLVNFTGNYSGKYSPQDILEAMSYDKKSLQGKPRFVMIDSIGSPVPFHGTFCTAVAPTNILQALKEHQEVIA